MKATTILIRPLAPLTQPAQRLVVAVRSWPFESQQRARRNALIASTALTQRRAELAEVEEYLAALGRDVGTRRLAVPETSTAPRAVEG